MLPLIVASVLRPCFWWKFNSLKSKIRHMLDAGLIESNSRFLLSHCNRGASTMAAAGKKVFVARKICEPALAILKEAGIQVDMWEHDFAPSKEQILGRVGGVEGLYTLGPLRIDNDIISAAGLSLKVVSCMAVGVDAIDIVELKKRKIRLGYTPGVLTDAVADIAVALVLATSRRILEMADVARSGLWLDWSPFRDLGVGLRNSTVGIVGLGRIGLATVKRLAPFGVAKFLYYSPTEKVEAREVHAEYVEFGTLLEKSDFVIACCSLNQSTREMFDGIAFRKMKPTSIFINVGRGGLVQQDDLVIALQTGLIGAAGLDVTTPEPLPPCNPLFKLKNCVILPHIGSAEIQTRTDMAVLASQNMVAGLSGQAMPAEYML